MSWAKPLIMGVLNITPDSFSDGGLYLDPTSAIEQAKELVAQGAQIIDIGGESTRPGAKRISPEEEQERVLGILQQLKQLDICEVSIDTMNSSTAGLAIHYGADYINDVSGGLADPEMFSVVAAGKAKFILGHWRGHSDNMDELAQYEDVAREVVAELSEQVAMAIAAGVNRDRIIVDPGLGFAKDMGQNWELVARLDELERLGLPILVGASRKRFLASALDPQNPATVSMPRRDVATAVLTALLLQRKLWGIRVHNVQATNDAIQVVAALKQAEQS